MRLISCFAQGELRLNRIEAFKDGVFAIIVTLPMLDLKVSAFHDQRSVMSWPAASSACSRSF